MIYETELSSGIRLIYEPVDNFRSVAIGIWIRNGSIDEEPQDAGISHFIEHMLFKGTESRTARDIADDMALVGGQINAFTAKEYTCCYAHTLDEHLPVAVEILADMILHSTFKEEEIVKEKGVIGEEIAMSDDSPEDIVHDQLEDAVFAGGRLANPILGTRETLAGFTRERLQAYIASHYTASNMLVAVVGNISPETLVPMLEEAFAGISKAKPPARGMEAPVSRRVFKYKEKDIEQVHLVLSFPAASYASEDKHIQSVLNTIIGGGINSRLFLGIREDKGLTYSIYSYLEAFLEAGTFNIYAAANAQQVEEVIANTILEIMKFLEEGISEKELFKVKQQIKSNLVIGFENLNNRMSSYGKSALMLGKIQSQDDLAREVDRVTTDSLMAFARRILNLEKTSLSMVGKLDGINIERIEALCKKS